MMLGRLAPALLAVIVATLLAPSMAQAQNIAALSVKGDKLYLIGEGKKGPKVLSVVTLKGASTDRILAIDIRAADGKLYGVTEKANVVRINLKTGKLKALFALDVKLKGVVSMDCDAVSDGCRLFSDKGFNAHFAFADETLIVDTDLAYAAGGGKPKVVAGAYTNSFVGALASELFDIDAATDRLYEQDPPSGGVLNPIAPVRPKVEAPVAFDILSFGEGDNLGLLIRRKKLSTLSFTTGEFSTPAAIKGLDVNVKDLAALPAPR